MRYADKEAELRGLHYVPLTAEVYNEMIRLVDELGITVAGRIIREEIAREGSLTEP